MNERPVGVTDDQVRDALRQRWDFDAATLDYAPLGFGSYHWTAVDAGGGRRFVTVDDLDTIAPTRAAKFEALDRALTTAHILRDDGLDFVVAPLRARDGDVVEHLSERYAIAVYPFVTGEVGAFGDAMAETDRAALLDVLATLHRASQDARTAAPQLGFEPIRSSAGQIEAALAATEQPWTGGPFSEPARQWCAEHTSELAALIERSRRRMAHLGTAPDDLVVTHGEPHPGNVMCTDRGLQLIDWDTVGLTRPERDLWWFADEHSATDGALEHYAEVAGRAPDPQAIALYRDAWVLSDLEVMLHVFRSEHGDDSDTRQEWQALNGLHWDGTPSAQT